MKADGAAVEGSADHQASASPALGIAMGSICVLITIAEPSKQLPELHIFAEYKTNNQALPFINASRNSRRQDDFKKVHGKGGLKDQCILVENILKSTKSFTSRHIFFFHNLFEYPSGKQISKTVPE